MSYSLRVRQFKFIVVLVCIFFLYVSESALAQNDLIINGSFETGNFDGWTTTRPAQPFVPWLVTNAGQGGGSPSVHTTQPQSGVFSAWNGFDAGESSVRQFTMYQNVTIPARRSVQLTWKDRVSWNMRDFPGSTQPRLYQVQIRNPSNQAILQTIYSFSAMEGTAGDTGWLTHTADLSVYAGQTIQLFFLEFIPERFTGPAQIEFDSISLIPGPPTAPFDFDGDGKTDYGIFRPSNRVWYIAGLEQVLATEFGISTDKITPADFDGDRKTDIGVFRDGVWYWLNSSNGNLNTIQFGTAGDIPVPADYTGDGRAELAIYRGGIWNILNLVNNQFQSVQFGISTDKPVPADYDGDRKTDVAVYRDGTWYLLKSSQGITTVQFGIASDKAVPADYDGDGRADVAVYRDGFWHLLQSTRGLTVIEFGLSTDKPTPGYYDGDDKADISVWRPSNGIFYVLRSNDNQYMETQWGVNGDVPLASVYVP